MLKQLDEFRNKLDRLMLLALHKRVALYGYESYTGRFLSWYARYYHGIEMEWLIDTHAQRGVGHTQVIYSPHLLRFDYKDVKDAVVWLAEPLTEEIKMYMESCGYVCDDTYFDFFGEIYGDDIEWVENDGKDVFTARKTGRKDIQFLEYLEWKYDVNFVQQIPREKMELVKNIGGSGYGCTTQREIFPILDACHCKPKENDAAFDFGCGKGGAIVSFLDYGFEHVGGVEYEPKVYDVLADNMKKLGISSSKAEILYGDATKITNELDKYNWFYFNPPFNETIFYPVIDHICESYQRLKRKIYIIYIGPEYKDYILSKGVFRLFIQPTIDTRKRVVDVFETYEQYRKEERM